MLSNSNHKKISFSQNSESWLCWFLKTGEGNHQWNLHQIRIKMIFFIIISWMEPVLSLVSGDINMNHGWTERHTKKGNPIAIKWGFCKMVMLMRKNKSMTVYFLSSHILIKKSHKFHQNLFCDWFRLWGLSMWWGDEFWFVPNIMWCRCPPLIILNIIVVAIIIIVSVINHGHFILEEYFIWIKHIKQLDWSAMMFIKSPFLRYPTCLIFAHVVWWSTALWTARTTRRRRPGRSLTLGYITSVGNFFN